MKLVTSMRQLVLRVSEVNLSTLFMLLSIFTVSWERFGNLSAGGYNIKLSIVLFAISLVLALVDSWKSRAALKPPFIVVAALGLVLVFAVLGFFSTSMFSAQMQSVALVTGALVPFLAVLLNLRLFGGLVRALNALIYGAVFASAFGIYQLLAFYLKLTQIVEYTATDVNGYGRIRAFSYESGYFGYFLVLAMVAVIARSVLTHTATNQWLIAFFGTTLVLANSRATFVTIPILIVLFLFWWPRKVPNPRVGWIALILGIGAVTVFAIKPDVLQALGVRFFSLFDPNEASSNAPRLAVLDSSWNIFVNNPIIGIGPSSLKHYLEQYGYRVDLNASPNSIVANNSLFQALLDGGLVLLMAQLTFVVIAIAIYLKRTRPTAWVLLCGWLTVLFVSGFVTSYFWDIKLWVFLALAVGAFYLQDPVKLKQLQKRERVL